MYAPQGDRASVFDNKVERASRENEMFGLKSERTHNLGLCPQRAEVVGLPRPASGFKREFDPGSESTLAACLTHASRTGKRGQLREYSGVRVSNT